MQTEDVKIVNDHWRDMRIKLKKPLLRKYWPKSSSTDSNSLTSFRSRHKERVNTRRKKGNDQDNFEKLLDVRSEVAQARNILKKTYDREMKKLNLIDIEWVKTK